MALNEKTSESVASIAGRILEMNKPNGVEQKLWEDILKIAGSALTQSPDNPKSSLYSKIPIRPYLIAKRPKTDYIGRGNKK